jgi:hypothetical protein
VPPLPVPEIPEVVDTDSGAVDDDALNPQGAEGPTATNPQNGEQPAGEQAEQDQGGWGFVPDSSGEPMELAYVPPVYSPKPHVVQESDTGATNPQLAAVPAELYGALDLMEREIDTAAAEEEEQTVLSATLKGTSLLLTAGFATWLLRGGSLLASLLSTMPLWRSFDPLPVLMAAKKREEKEANIARHEADSRASRKVDGMFTPPSANAAATTTTEGKT